MRIDSCSKYLRTDPKKEIQLANQYNGHPAEKKTKLNQNSLKFVQKHFFGPDLVNHSLSLVSFFLTLLI